MPVGVGPEGLLLPPPQEIANTRIMKNTESPIFLKRLWDAPRTRANTAAREYQSLKPGSCKEASGGAVVLTSKPTAIDSFPLCNCTEAGENAQLAPCGRLLQLKLTRPLKAAGPGGLVAPDIP